MVRSGYCLASQLKQREFLVRASATYVFYLHGDFASMCYVVTSLHARVSFLLAARSAFFPALRV
jgi:hypothetical protein